MDDFTDIVIDSWAYIAERMHDCPEGLIPLGYLRKPEVEALRAAGIRAWIGKKPDIGSAQGPRWLTFVEPMVIDLQKMYRKFAAEGRSFAGLAEWEFILSSVPQKS